MRVLLATYDSRGGVEPLLGLAVRLRELGAEVQAAVHLDVPRAELVRRLLARGRGSDDTQEVIEHRLQVYLDETVPLLEYYANREWMFAVDGAQPPDAVHQEIVARLHKLSAFASEAG